MADYRVVEVRSRKDLMQFIKFPDILYRNCPQYVPALHKDQVRSLTTVSTAKYCPHRMWMVKDGRKVADERDQISKDDLLHLKVRINVEHVDHTVSVQRQVKQFRQRAAGKV